MRTTVLDRPAAGTPIRTGNHRAAPQSMLRLLARFAAAGLLVLAALAAVIDFLAVQAGTAQAIQSAEQITAMTARAVVEPQLTDAVVAGEPAAVAALDSLIREHVIDGSLVRVKVWSTAGRILYSDEPELIGHIYPLGDDELQVLSSGQPDSQISDLSKPENSFEQSYGQLLEVYSGMHSLSGQPLLFEAYFRYDAVVQAGQAQWRQYAPAALGGLIVLELVQIPFAWSMARRVQRQQRGVEQLLQHAVDASDAERRRIAGDLHDGVVQQLTGATFALDAATLRTTDAKRNSTLIAKTAGDLRRIVGQLRSLLVDIYPPNLAADSGLPGALTELANGLEENGIRVHLELDGAHGIPLPSRALLFRCAQEILRNVGTHSQGDAVIMRIVRQGDCVELEIADNGQGFDPGQLPRRRQQGHIGLLAINDLITTAGGRLTVHSRPGLGTTVRVEVPTQ